MLNRETMYKLLQLLDDVYDNNLTNEEIVKQVKTLADETSKQNIQIDDTVVIPRGVLETSYEIVSAYIETNQEYLESTDLEKYERVGTILSAGLNGVLE